MVGLDVVDVTGSAVVVGFDGVDVVDPLLAGSQGGFWVVPSLVLQLLKLWLHVCKSWSQTVPAPHWNGMAVNPPLLLLTQR